MVTEMPITERLEQICRSHLVRTGREPDFLLLPRHLARALIEEWEPYSTIRSPDLVPPVATRSDDEILAQYACGGTVYRHHPVHLGTEYGAGIHIE